MRASRDQGGIPRCLHDSNALTAARLSGQRPHQSFASLRHSGYRVFVAGSATAMLADSIEHVISYWVVFQKFHSPALGGFAVVSH